jgi:hypothetical protein
MKLKKLVGLLKRPRMLRNGGTIKSALMLLGLL